MTNTDVTGGEVTASKCSEKMDFRRRRSRLRTTAFPTLREIEYAIRTGSSTVRPASFTRKRHRRSRDRTCRPSDRSRVNSLRSEIPEIKPTACGGPYVDGSSESRGRREWTCANGSRVSWLVCEHLVGTCASSLLRIVWARADAYRRRHAPRLSGRDTRAPIAEREPANVTTARPRVPTKARDSTSSP